MTTKNLPIYIFSDIHLELQRCKLQLHGFSCESHACDAILVLAGDIGNPYSKSYKNFLDTVSKKFTKVFIVAGNHEYYNNGKTVEETNTHIDSICRKFGISFLNNSHEYYNGYMWIGTTLWSNVSKNTEYYINDTKCIKSMTLEKYNSLHKASLEYFETFNAFKGLDCSESLDCSDKIIITHHVPLHELTHEVYKDSPYYKWFSSDMSKLIKDMKNVRAWIYGHTHMASVQSMYGIKFICNPIGYNDEISLYTLDPFIID